MGGRAEEKQSGCGELVVWKIEQRIYLQIQSRRIKMEVVKQELELEGGAKG